MSFKEKDDSIFFLFLKILASQNISLQIKKKNAYDFGLKNTFTVICNGVLIIY